MLTPFIFSLSWLDMFSSILALALLRCITISQFASRLNVQAHFQDGLFVF